MDRVIQSICGMLQSPDGMRRCAAAMVIAELRPKDGAVVKALGDALKDANQLLTRYVLEAFEAIGSRSVVPYVLPLLDSPETETKLRAAAIIARTGGDNVANLRDQFLKANPQQKRVLIDILARIHNREAMQLILDVLFDPDFELVKEACQAIRRHITDAEPKKRAALHRQVATFMT
jgi:HEAT repeat protein